MQCSVVSDEVRPDVWRDTGGGTRGRGDVCDRGERGWVSGARHYGARKGFGRCVQVKLSVAEERCGGSSQQQLGLESKISRAGRCVEWLVLCSPKSQIKSN